MNHISIKRFFKAVRLSPIIVISLAMIIGFGALASADDTPAISDFTATPYSFNPNASNPINQYTVFSYTLSNIKGAQVVLDIENASGDPVRTIDGGFQSSGTHSITWDGKDEDGNTVSDGEYTGNLIVGSGDSYSFLLKWGGYTTDGDPRGIATDHDNNVYVVDINNNCVQKFSSNGTFITQWGSLGSGEGQFGLMSGIAVYSYDNGTEIVDDVYVVDTGNNRIQKFKSDGTFLTQWGISGSEDGQFNNPYDIDVDSSGNVYVIDTDNNRVQKFSSDSTYLTQWGSLGSGDGQFSNPFGIAVDSTDNIYVADSGNNRILKFDSDGIPIADGESSWEIAYSFVDAYGVTVDSSGNIYVADPGNNSIMKFDSNGNVDSTWESGGPEDSQFSNPFGITVDSNDDVYIADSSNNRVQKLDLNSNLIVKWDLPPSKAKFGEPNDVAVDSLDNIYVTDAESNSVKKFGPDGTFIKEWGGYGFEDGQFDYPYGIAVDSNNNIYVVDCFNDRIQKFDSDGNIATEWGTGGSIYGTADVWFSDSSGIAIDSNGNIYVADTYNDRILKFDSNGDYISNWGEGELYYPIDITVDSDDNIYVADTDNNRIIKYNSTDTQMEWESYGSVDSQFDAPYSLTVVSDSIYVADSNNNRIVKLDSNGNFINEFGEYGSGEGQLDSPSSIVIDSQNDIYVLDFNNQRIQKFAPGTDLSQDLTANISVTVDSVEPETEIFLSNYTTGDNNWYTSDVTVTLSASDTGSGVAKTEYSFDNLHWTTYTGPFTIEETKNIYYHSIDNAGNVESTEPYTSSYNQLDIDFNSDAYTGQQNYWGDTNCYYPVNPGTDYTDLVYGEVPMDMQAAGANNVWLSNGNDRTSNLTIFPTSLALDTIVPRATTIWVVGMDGGWCTYGSQVNIKYTLNGTEYVSSYTPNDWCYEGTGDGLNLWVDQHGMGDIAVARIDIPEAGLLTNITVEDVSGEGGASIPVFAVTVRNEGITSHLETIKIDKTAPEITFNSPADGAYYKSSDLPLTPDYDVVDDNSWSVTYEDVYSTDEGNHTYTVTVKDNAGNKTTANVNYTVDNTAPEVTFIAPYPGAYYNTANPPNASTLPETPSYIVTDTSPYTVTTSGYTDDDGEHFYQFEAEDAAGNIYSTIVTYYVDNIPPEVSITSPTESDFWAGGSTQQITWTATDNLCMASNPITLDYFDSNTNTWIEIASGEANDGIYDWTVPTLDIDNARIRITAVDQAANITIESDDFVIDSTAPEVSIIALVDGTFYTSSSLPAADYTASDVNLDTVAASGYSTEEGTHTYTVTATDKAGNLTTESVTYTVDDTAPVVTITGPIDGGFYKSSELPVGAYTVTESSPYTVSESGYSTDEGTHTYTVTVTDEAGNETTESVTYTVDDTAPVVTITVPDDGAFYNSDNLPAGAYTVIEANIATEVESTTDNGDGTFTYTVTVTDKAGNSTTESVTYTVDDTAPSAPTNLVKTTTDNDNTPTFTWNASIDATSGIDYYEVSIDGGSWTDIGNVTTYTLDTALSDGNHTFQVRAVDIAGNMGSDAILTFDVDITAPSTPTNLVKTTTDNDNTPTFTWNASIDATSGIDYYEVSIDGGSWTDIGNVTTYTLDTALSDGNHTFQVRAVDIAGNTGSSKSDSFIIDTTAPTFDEPLPADIVDYEATSTLTLVDIGTATATDTASEVTITNDAPADGFPVGTTIVTWTATDASGNSVTYAQSVTIVDTTAPVVTPPANIIIEATGPFTTIDLGIATATDNVGVALLTNDAPDTFPVGTTTVTWTATDAEGNVGTATQTVTIVDTTPPIITPPADITSEAPVTSDDIGDATATDNVGVVSLTNDAPDTFPVGTTTVTWTATDAEGNSSTATQLVTVVDTTAPVITPPADLIDVEAPVTSADIGDATATDNVGVVSLTNDAPDTFPVGTTTVTWTATDAAGNTNTATQTVTVVDTTAPVFTDTPADIIDYEATGTLTLVDIGTATATDTGSDVTITNNAPADGFPVGTTIVTWTATDASGNTATYEQSITIVDTTAPEVIAPADITDFQATGPFTQIDIGDATATDAVGVVSLTNDAPDTFPVGTTTVTWIAADAAGNSSTATQTVTVVDTTAPTFTSTPADIVDYEATGTLTLVDIGMATATDTVSNVTITNDAPADGFPVGTTIVNWTATDASDNSTTYQQSVTIEDTTAPVITAPADLIDVEAPVTSDDIGTATATDAVGVVSLTNDAPALFPIGTTIVTWTAADAAGNSSTATQTVTVVDSTTEIDATVDIKPETLNLKSNSIWNSITAFIELPSEYSVWEIDVSTIELEVNGVTIPAYIFPTWVGDYDWDRIPDRMVKFNRQAVIQALAGETGNIIMTITGQLTDGQEFAGSDTVRVINPSGWWWWNCDDDDNDCWWNTCNYNDNCWGNHGHNNDNCWWNHDNDDDDDKNKGKNKDKDNGKSKDKDNKCDKSKDNGKGKNKNYSKGKGCCK